MPFIQPKKRPLFSASLLSKCKTPAVLSQAEFQLSLQKNSLIVHPGGGRRTLLSIVLNHWTGRKQQSNHITVSLGKKGQLSTGNLLWLIPARPLLSSPAPSPPFTAVSEAHRPLTAQGYRLHVSPLHSLESTANSEKPPPPPPLRFSFVQFYFGTFITSPSLFYGSSFSLPL